MEGIEIEFFADERMLHYPIGEEESEGVHEAVPMNSEWADLNDNWIYPVIKHDVVFLNDL